MTDVRVRFAPSPTGLLHIGGLRTALYNYLFARRHGGAFVLRIEDTDRERFVEDAEQDILDALSWAGMGYDEGPRIGGPFGPYYQSERKSIYKAYVDRLLAEGNAYYAFDTPDELQAMRDRLTTGDNPNPRYDTETRLAMRNSYTIPAAEVKARVDAGEAYVVRLNVPVGKAIQFNDIVRGTVVFQSAEVDDQVLMKSDGMPTYHMANVVDDHLMHISHIVRGEEWLSSTPKHILLYRALGWEPPQTAHLPLILSPNGGKLSKRNADKMGIPVNVRQYRELGYEPEALVNYLAFLGWNPGVEQEVFSLDELVEVFSLERIGKGGTQYSPDKMNWFNQQHLRRLDDAVLAERIRPDLQAAGLEADEAYLRRVAGLMKDRITFLRELTTTWRFFFEEPAGYDPDGVAKRWKSDSPALLDAFAARLEALPDFTAAGCEEQLRLLGEERGAGAGRIIHPVRLAVSGITHGPSLFELLETLGRDTCVRRLRLAIERLPASDAE
ncbi:MAG: glutamate--tRNA ligase [Rhodothermales bacterium]|nr:glutamate--tRNA ligase [Rhodothermales bacterium]